MSDWAAIGSVATGSVATGSVALGGVATAGVVVDGVAWGSVVAGFIAAGCVAGACCAESCVATGVPAAESAGERSVGAVVVVDGVAWGSVVAGFVAAGFVAAGFVAAGCVAGACRAESWVATGVPAAESAGEGSVGAVVVVVADGTVALVGAPAEFPPPASGVPPVSTRVAWLAGVGAALAGAAGVVTCTSCWTGVAEPLARGPLAGLNDPPLVVVVVVVETLRVVAVTLRSAREVRLESTAVRVASTRFRVPVSDAELLPTSTGEAEAPFALVVEAIVPACAAFA